MMVTVLARNADEAMMGSGSLHSVGLWSQAVGFVLCIWQECGFSCCEKFHNLLFKESLKFFYFQCDLKR
jgi:hypothetical protein